MTAGSEAAPTLPPKVDPVKLELRARPRPAVRFRKGLIVGLAGGVAALVAMVSWFALEPSGLRFDAEPKANPLRPQQPDALEDAPASYDQIPVLGPPLPGDLGRPILKARTSMEESERAMPETAAYRAQEQRIADIRASSLLVGLREGPKRDVAVVPTSGKQVTVEAEEPRARLSAGTIIPASLITGIDSDVPGIVLAQVTEPVRDSATGSLTLIPQGARLAGDYDSKVAFGQERAMLSWTRIVFPDGRSLALDKLPAADRAGYSGLADQVDFHGGRILKGIALSTALGIGTELTLQNGDGDLARALADSAQFASSRAGDEFTRRNLDVKPTIRVRPGWPIRVILHQDISLLPWKE